MCSFGSLLLFFQSLKETMLVCCEAFCKCLATDGYYLRAEVACKLYAFLATLDCSLPTDADDDGGSRCDRAAVGRSSFTTVISFTLSMQIYCVNKKNKTKRKRKTYRRTNRSRDRCRNRRETVRNAENTRYFFQAPNGRTSEPTSVRKTSERTLRPVTFFPFAPDREPWPNDCTTKRIGKKKLVKFKSFSNVILTTRLSTLRNSKHTRTF